MTEYLLYIQPVAKDWAQEGGYTNGKQWWREGGEGPLKEPFKPPHSPINLELALVISILFADYLNKDLV